MYMNNLKNKILIDSRIYFFENGFLKIVPKNKISKKTIEPIKFKGLKSDLNRNTKDAGVLTNKLTNVDFPKYIEFIDKFKYIKSAEDILNKDLYPISITHLLSDDKTKELIWHRDSYTHNGKFVGRPYPVFKIAIYLNETDKENGITGFIPGKININFKNKYIDFLYAYLMSFMAKYEQALPGDAMFFTSEVMHHRPKSKIKKKYREVIIINLTTSKDVAQDHYFNKKDTALYAYIKLLNIKSFL